MSHLKDFSVSIALTLLTGLVSGAVQSAPNGRLLASQCFQCHGPSGKSVSGIDGLAGESASEIFSEMKEMQSKALREPDIMHSQALIYTDDELRALAAALANATTPSGGSEPSLQDKDAGSRPSSCRSVSRKKSSSSRCNEDDD